MAATIACGASETNTTSVHDAGIDVDVAEGGVVQPSAGCDPAAEPKDAPKCVVSGFGAFVDAAGGADANAGTKESPVKTIGAALGKLRGKPRVYVCEGCSGLPGQGGEGGGASIALLASQSPVSLVGCTLTTADGGPGANGSAGGTGIAGGTGGTRGATACLGGQGGRGGNGGAGGGGAGGVSVGVLYKGPRPSVDATIATGASGAPGNDAIEGQKANSLEMQ